MLSKYNTTTAEVTLPCAMTSRRNEKNWIAMEPQAFYFFATYSSSTTVNNVLFPCVW